ncbi:coiled-coil domain-containing protein 137 [Brachionichthys hirsutus]|uniref:coiled-coil domain-containing protein 137 n=1 Tax=Brachionichthys hirsutus TaxID=412623 RepID=UPI00360436F0
MGKNKKSKTKESGKQEDKPGKRPGGKNHKGNAKAEHDHLQDIPYRLREIMKSKERMKTGSAKAKKPRQAIFPKDSCEGDIPALRFRRGKKESVKTYLQRMESETKHILFLTNNQVDRKPELDEGKQESPANHGKSESKKEHDKVRLQRLHKKKLDRREEKKEKEMFVDNVPFGEVAMAPPSLSAKPRKGQLKSQKESKKLLLHSLLGHAVNATHKPSMARKRIMEEERERVVQAYRHLKKQKQLQQEARAATLEKLKNPQ